MFRGGDYVDDPKFYNPQAIKNSLDVSVCFQKFIATYFQVFILKTLF